MPANNDKSSKPGGSVPVKVRHLTQIRDEIGQSHRAHIELVRGEIRENVALLSKTVDAFEALRNAIEAHAKITQRLDDGMVTLTGEVNESLSKPINANLAALNATLTKLVMRLTVLPAFITHELHQAQTSGPLAVKVDELAAQLRQLTQAVLLRIAMPLPIQIQELTPVQIAETWHVRLPFEDHLIEAMVERFTERTVTLRHVDCQARFAVGYITRTYERAELKFVERIWTRQPPILREEHGAGGPHMHGNRAPS